MSLTFRKIKSTRAHSSTLGNTTEYELFKDGVLVGYVASRYGTITANNRRYQPGQNVRTKVWEYWRVDERREDGEDTFSRAEAARILTETR